MEDIQSIVERTRDDADTGSYLVHVMRTTGMGADGEFQVGYYDESSDKVTNFSVGKDRLVKEEPSEVFKKAPKILPLDLSDVKLSLADVESRIDEVVSESYSQHPVQKRILILQCLPDGQVYNVTLVTATFMVINLRFDAASGELVREHMEPVFSFKQE